MRARDQRGGRPRFSPRPASAGGSWERGRGSAGPEGEVSATAHQRPPYAAGEGIEHGLEHLLRSPSKHHDRITRLRVPFEEMPAAQRLVLR
jgi:hypothetical protein